MISVVKQRQAIGDRDILALFVYKVSKESVCWLFRFRFDECLVQSAPEPMRIDLRVCSGTVLLLVRDLRWRTENKVVSFPIAYY